MTDKPVKHYEKGQIICQQGDAGQKLVILTKGYAAITVLLPDGRETLLHYGMSGCMYGFESTLTGDPYKSNLRAVEDCDVVWVCGKEVTERIKNDTELLASLIDFERRRSKLYSRHNQLLCLVNSKSRIATLFLGMAAHIGVPEEEGILLPVQVTHQQISDIVHLDRVTASRVISGFLKEGALKKKNGYLVLQQPEILKQYAATL